MINTININKSKMRGKVFREEWIIAKILDYLFLFFISVCPSSIFIIETYVDNLEGGSNYFTAIFFMPIFLVIISILLIYAILNMDNLKKVEGINHEQNRLIVNEILISLGWSVCKNNKQITVAAQNDYFSNGEEIVIIYDKTDLLVNCISFGKNRTKSPFHWFINRNCEKKFIDEFNKRIQELI